MIHNFQLPILNKTLQCPHLVGYLDTHLEQANRELRMWLSCDPQPAWANNMQVSDLT